MKRLFHSIGAVMIGALASLGDLLGERLFAYQVRSGLIATLDQIPGAADFAKYRVTNPDSSEVIRQRLYDYQCYPAGGQAQFSFFTLPQGQGITSTNGAVVATAKTASDTNMTNAGTLPSGMEYLIESIEVYFKPGTSDVANTFVPANITTPATGALSIPAISGLDDTDLVYNTGLLTFNVLNKVQLQETPLRSFPPKTWMVNDVALATAVGGAPLTAMSANSYAAGRAYYLEPPVSLQPTVNFGVTITYPAAQALPSTFVGRIGVVFDGYLRRASQ